VDHEKEPCGCPPSSAKGNEFPLAQSEGLAPTPKPAPLNTTGAPAQPIPPLVYKSEDHASQPAAEAASAQAATPEGKPAVKKKGSKLGRFFRKIFGAE